MRWEPKLSVLGFGRYWKSCFQLQFQSQVQLQLQSEFPLKSRLHLLPFELRLQFKLRPRNLSGPEFKLQFRIRHQLSSTRHQSLTLPWLPPSPMLPLSFITSQ